VGGNAPELTITNATRADTGDYWVEVHDAYETVPSEAASLYVSLTILQHPVGATIPVGGTWTLSTEAGGGTGPLNYQWKLEHEPGVPVNVGDNAAEYIIAGATLDQAGTYWVEVSDDIDTVTSTTAVVEVEAEEQIPAAKMLTLVMLVSALAVIGAARQYRRGYTL